MVTGSAFGRARNGVPLLGPPRDLPVEVLESKLYTPTVRPAVVSRPQLVDRLLGARPVPTVAVVAPAGYGKTTLLALWAEADGRPFAWVSLDEHDNDPIVLLTHLAVALDRISPLPPETFDALRSGGVSVPATVVPRLGSALARLPRPLVLVVDDVHHLQDGPSLDALVTLVGHVRGTTQIALAGRGMPVPLARPRAQGRVVDITTDDLAFTADGARTLLAAAGARLPEDEVVALTRRTEGWAAGLYLAALAGSAPVTGRRDARSGWAEGLMADYLDSELLSGLSSRDLSFLTRTSVLDRLSGPLCDAVLQESGSTAVLHRLQRDNLFLTPLDGRHRWYRYHPMFRDLLRARFADDGPGAGGDLLRRAADWFETEGHLETALHYAQAAEDVDRVARIAVLVARPMYAAGRSATVMEWFDWVDARGGIARHPAAAALAGYLCALTGRPAAAERWADIAERCAGGLPADDGPFAMWVAELRGVMCPRGVEQMRRDVDEPGGVPRAGPAADGEYVVRLFLSGVASMLLGDVERAEARFIDATELTDETLRMPFSSVIAAFRATLCLRRGAWDDAEILTERALSVVRRGRADSHITSAVVFAVAARVALHRRDVGAARRLLAEAQRLRPLLSHAMPWFAVETLLEMVEVSVGLGEQSGARLLLRDADAVLRRRPDLGSLGKRTDELRGRLASPTAPRADSPALTSAELRVLPLLLTHLTLESIADRLFLSRHTVKSQVSSMYQKLGVHTRDDAVARARELGLIEP